TVTVADMSPSASPSKECFVVCPIGAAGSETRKRTDQVHKHVICATLEPMGYSVTRGDSIEQSGQITSQVIDKLLNVDLVIADLTDQNANVFYELAVRHAVRKPFIQIMTDGQKLPFDIQSLRTIFFNHTDLDSVYEAKQMLAAMAKSLEEGSAVETPMTYTLDLQSLRQSEDTEARGIAEIIDELATLKKMMREPRPATRSPNPDLAALRAFVQHLKRTGRLEYSDRNYLVTDTTTPVHDKWVDQLLLKLDPWGSAPPSPPQDEEPPF
ncbi:MAG: hypothetical protein LC775_19230, partial [Acidobacteria bacterium]|nr:hypothetical protein [Acidobacteriota bacterium]